MLRSFYLNTDYTDKLLESPLPYIRVIRAIRVRLKIQVSWSFVVLLECSIV